MKEADKVAHLTNKEMQNRPNTVSHSLSWHVVSGQFIQNKGNSHLAERSGHWGHVFDSSSANVTELDQQRHYLGETGIQVMMHLGNGAPGS